jgi:PAS domain S-box-containing protein
MQDISARKASDEERGRLLAILEKSEDFVGIADMEGNLQYHNPGARKMIGLPPDADLSHLKISDKYRGKSSPV